MFQIIVNCVSFSTLGGTSPIFLIGPLKYKALPVNSVCVATLTTLADNVLTSPITPCSFSRSALTKIFVAISGFATNCPLLLPESGTNEKANWTDSPGPMFNRDLSFLSSQVIVLFSDLKTPPLDESIVFSSTPVPDILTSTTA